MNNIAFPSKLGDFDFHVLQKGMLTQTGPLRLSRAHCTTLTQMGISTQISRATVSVSGIQKPINPFFLSIGTESFANPLFGVLFVFSACISLISKLWRCQEQKFFQQVSPGAGAFRDSMRFVVRFQEVTKICPLRRCPSTDFSQISLCPRVLPKSSFLPVFPVTAPTSQLSQLHLTQSFHGQCL